MRFTRLLTITALAALALSTEAWAQVDLEITPFGGGTLFLADLPSEYALHTGGTSDRIITDGAYDNAWTLGLNAGFRFNEKWAIEGMFSWIPTRLTAASGLPGSEDVNAYMYGLTGLFYIPIGGIVQPFVGLGAGAETFDYRRSGWESHTDFMGNVVGGLYVALTDVTGLRLEARDCFARMGSGVDGIDDAWENDLMLTLGVSFRTPLRR
jgi:outer membrane protein W